MGADTVPTGLSLRGAAAAATSCLAFPFFGFGDGVSIRSGLPGSGFSTRLTRVSRAGGAGAGARRGVTGSGGGAELFVRAGGAVTLAGIFGVGRSGARGAGGGCSAGGGGTTVTGAVTGGISGRVAGSVEAMRVGGVASPLEGAEGTQRRTARSRSARYLRSPTAPSETSSTVAARRRCLVWTGRKMRRWSQTRMTSAQVIKSVRRARSSTLRTIPTAFPPMPGAFFTTWSAFPPPSSAALPTTSSDSPTILSADATCRRIRWSDDPARRSGLEMSMPRTDARALAARATPGRDRHGILARACTLRRGGSSGARSISSVLPMRTGRGLARRMIRLRGKSRWRSRSSRSVGRKRSNALLKKSSLRFGRHAAG